MRVQSFRPIYRPAVASSAALLLSIGCVKATEPAFSSYVAIPAHEQCRIADSDQRWLRDALGGWAVVLRRYLKRDDHPLPQIVTYDARCSYRLTRERGSRPRWVVTSHDGQIRLPSGALIPAGPNAFNAATGERENFIVMSLPSIWRPVAPKSDIPLDWFLEGILIHELAHDYQTSATPKMSFMALHRAHNLPANVDDDAVQEAFKKIGAYVQAYEAERDALYRAVSAPSDREARAAACDALGMMRSRRERYFTGDKAHWQFVEELSLTTEGLGQWVAYSWLTRGRRLAPALVQQKLRGPFWSQDEGLALFLVIDRLVPNWQQRLFDSSPATAEPLLANACGR